MNKRQATKHLINEYNAKKVNFGNHDIELILNNKTYHIVFLKLGFKSQLTVNSKTHFEVANGKLDGIRFIKKSSTIYELRNFSMKENKILFLTNKPFRILQYLNESDIIDITDKKEVHGYKLFHSFKDFKEL